MRKCMCEQAQELRKRIEALEEALRGLLNTLLVEGQRYGNTEQRIAQLRAQELLEGVDMTKQEAVELARKFAKAKRGKRSGRDLESSSRLGRTLRGFGSRPRSFAPLCVEANVV